MKGLSVFWFFWENWFHMIYNKTLGNGKIADEFSESRPPITKNTNPSYFFFVFFVCAWLNYFNYLNLS